MPPQWSCILEPQPQHGSAPSSCNAESPHTCLCLGRSPARSPLLLYEDYRSVPLSGVLQPLCTSCLTFGPSPAAHRSPTGCERTPRPAGPGRLVQEDRAGLGPSPQPKGCCPYPGAEHRNQVPHQLLWPCDKGQHLAHDKGQGSSEPRIQSLCFKDQSLYGT